MVSSLSPATIIVGSLAVRVPRKANGSVLKGLKFRKQGVAYEKLATRLWRVLASPEAQSRAT
jgi:hypothetical protein